MSPPPVSIVIPVLHDTAELAAQLDTLATDREPPAAEVIVANGDPGDPTLAPLRARHHAVRWIDGAPGRGAQMNAGAAAATGRWLVFLHADTRLDAAWRQAIVEADRRPDVVGGAFRFAVASPRRVARLLERMVAARVRWLGLPYGDQVFFVRRATFEALDGYRPLPLMEDVEFIRRLARAGALWFPPVVARVSPRRWERDGWLRRSVANVVLTTLYFAGVSPGRLAHWYYGRPQPGRG